MDFDHDFSVSLPVRSEEQQLQDVADVGPIELLRRTLKMWKENRAVFMCIQLTMVVPLMICLFLYNITVLSFALSIAVDTQDAVDEYLSVLKIAFIFVLLLIILALHPSLYGAILYTVGSLNDGKTITISEVFKAIPGLRKALRSTQKWGALLSLPVFIVLAIVSGLSIYGLMYFLDHQTGLMYFLDHQTGQDLSSSWLIRMGLPLFLVAVGVLLPFFFFQSTVLQMTQCVACLEGTHGLAAIKKGWSLLRGRWKVALQLSALLDLPQILVCGLIVITVASLLYMKYAFVGQTVICLILMVLLMATAGMFQIPLMTRTLFYISCKAYHHESFDMGIHEYAHLHSESNLHPSAEKV